VELAKQLLPAGAVYFAMDEKDVSRILAHPLTVVGSDGLAHDECPHPRLWGSFPRVLGRYSREQGLFSLETAIHKMTGLSASRYGLNRATRLQHPRGQIAVGFNADLVLFDPATVIDCATYDAPTTPSAGIERVYVNGRLAALRGQTLNGKAGRVLRHS